MAERPRFFDDIAGLAGGALSAFQGLRDEMESQMRARMDEMIRKLDLVRREEFDAVAEMAANARAGQEAAETRIAALEARMGKAGASEADPASLPPGGTEPAPSPSPAGRTDRTGASEGDPAGLPPDGGTRTV